MFTGRYFKQQRTPTIDNPIAKAKLRDAAIRLEQEIRYEFIQRATNAITLRDAESLKAAMGRVVQCDKAFELSTFPTPLDTAPTPPANKFLEGYYAGCVAKQKRSPLPFNDRQLQIYCACMTDRASSAGINGNSSEADIGRVVDSSHNACLAKLK